VNALIICADARCLPLRPGSVHLAISSPGYFGLRWYPGAGANQIGAEKTPEEYLRSLWRVSDQVWEVLWDRGSWFVNLGQKFATAGGYNDSGISGGPSQLQDRSQRATDFKPATRRNAPDRYVQNPDWCRPKSVMLLPQAFALGMICPRLYRDPIDPPPPGRSHPQWIIRAPMKVVTEDPAGDCYLWDKPNSLPSSKTDAVNLTHEDVFHFTKSERYFAAIDEIREPQKTVVTSTGATRYRKKGEPLGDRMQNRFSDRANPDRANGGLPDQSGKPHSLGKVPGSVWRIASEPLKLPTWRVVSEGRTVAWFLPRPAPKPKPLGPNAAGFFDPDPSGRIATLRRKLEVRRTGPEQLVVNEAGVLVPKPGGRDMAYEDALKLMRAMGLSGGRLSLRPVVQHFAAFPTVVPEKIIRGWSPSGICTVCNEPRRPVVEREREQIGINGQRQARLDGRRPAARNGGLNLPGSPKTRESATITGYACRCPDTSAPTRPAVVFDPFAGTGTTLLVAKSLGRAGVGTDLSHAYAKLADWHCTHGGAKTERRAWEHQQGMLL
jgi:DNA methylase